ncbi:hypothetical protein [Jeongeupia sp. USM3]|uniref:hypothetical protein n=1 Tax=Jeongeupia sp. USM3 TaxID=1906741 RepID=UPI00089DFA24|nr:hypothetical protein [Jeongeupia sp. USM3]AOY00241.1 hypothetical protein BJP62_07155 [Jeongeupia sp. USM3]
MLRTTLIALALAMPLATAAHAADATQTVHFARGSSSARFQHRIAGKDIRDYVLGARAGQTLAVDLRPANVYFNILPADSDAALYNGSINGSHASVTLPHDGNYTVRVYQMGGAASSGKTSAYTLAIGITGPQPAAGKAGAGNTVDLSDLVGARAAGGEAELQRRGFQPAGGSKHGGKSHTLWHNNGQCVEVTTANGRYSKLTTVDPAECN